MQQWCCSSLMTVCQRLAHAQSRRLPNFNRMASRQVCDSISTCTSNLGHAASAASKQMNKQHADQYVSQLLLALRTSLQQQCHVNTSASQSQSLNATLKIAAYSTPHAVQNAATSIARPQASTNQKLWRQSARSLASKHSGETSLSTKAIEQSLGTIHSYLCTLLQSYFPAPFCNGLIYDPITIHLTSS